MWRDWVFGILLWFAGFLVVPVLCLATPQGARNWRWLDHIYGNPYDPLDGDLAYRSEVGEGHRFRWSQLRNPLNAFLRGVGPAGIVEAVTVADTHNSDGELVCRVMTASISGRHYSFVQRRLVFGLWLWWGYKLLDDWRPRDRGGVEGVPRVSRLEKGHWFDNQMILWPIKNRVI